MAELIPILQARALDVNERDVFGRTALHYAVDAVVVSALAGLGADVNVCDSDGVTPLAALLIDRPGAANAKFVAEALIAIGAGIGGRWRAARHFCTFGHVRPTGDGPSSCC